MARFSFFVRSPLSTIAALINALTLCLKENALARFEESHPESAKYYADEEGYEDAGDYDYEDDEELEEGSLITLSEEDGVRYLHFGTEWVQGAMRMSRPNDLVLTYTQKMMGWLLFKQPTEQERIVLLGLGAASLLKFCLSHTPAEIETIELDEQVTRMCQAFFRLPFDRRSTITHADAEEWIRQPQRAQSIDVLMVDVYDAEAQGPVCSSLAFYEACAQALRPEGMVSINLFGSHPSYEENLRHIKKAFHGRVLVFPEIDEGNVVVFAFADQKLLNMSTQALLDRATQVEVQTRLPARRWAKMLLAMRPIDSTFTIP